MGWKMASPTDGTDLEASLLSFEKLDRASPDLWPEQLPGVAEFAASFKSPITSSPPKWMAEIERDDIDMLKELGSLTTANLMEKVRGLQNLAYQLGLDEYSFFSALGKMAKRRSSLYIFESHPKRRMFQKKVAGEDFDCSVLILIPILEPVLFPVVQKHCD
ncbi:protein lin-52 homolog isoform X1 [Castor canadensis]|uniref:Protein lin-52 homolog n=1 Tax=Castor canadensis TaxID=51338 RepID=A0A8B7UVG8_CASCN|nr:protein lin-52 homolog [Castor canadensis]